MSISIIIGLTNNYVTGRRSSDCLLALNNKQINIILRVVKRLACWIHNKTMYIQWRAGSCLPEEARVHLEYWRPLFTL